MIAGIEWKQIALEFLRIKLRGEQSKDFQHCSVLLSMNEAKKNYRNRQSLQENWSTQNLSSSIFFSVLVSKNEDELCSRKEMASTH